MIAVSVLGCGGGISRGGDIDTFPELEWRYPFLILTSR